MDGMDMTPPPPPPSSSSSMSNHSMHNDHNMMMHMTFFWGSNSEILFSGWPGTRTGMYVLALIFVFVLAVLVEWLSHCRFIKPAAGSASRVRAGLLQTLLHALRLGLAYLVMLAVMSFNAGVFLVVVAGHAVGFLVFGSAVFKRGDGDKVGTDLPPMSTC
ncbi:Copper transporter 6 [Morus notabilis]|uniref:Copper transport protein n=1 Tax=Morus notabilis TaxID=981085 RepID=W9QEG8_9ROSA|nr:copper transporter 6 [Morus notabilis]EXB30465.1 Copper transporter 6 [Morus notabilis]